MKYCMIETAFNDLEELNKVMDKLFQDRLISGGQVLESRSKWRWNGKLEKGLEYLLFMKTKKELVNEIYQVIKKIHHYEVFEFAVMEIDSCSGDYLNWIDKETR